MTSFDQLETNHQIAEKQYTAALQTFERARVIAARRSIYPPSCLRCCLPDVSWPQHRLLIALLGVAAVAATYWIVTRAIARVFDYRM
jgi:capsule polysaccharide export protein KpsE/RkpR